MAEAFATYLPPVYPYNVIGGQRQIKQMDFSPEIDIIPISDPVKPSPPSDILEDKYLAVTGRQAPHKAY